MIEAAKSRWFNAWFARHARGRIGKTFGRVLVGGLETARAAVAEAPVLLVANHTTWWDALVALYVSELLLDSDGYALMDASNLRKAPFFRRVGAFGVDLDNPASGARAIRHAAKLLVQKRRTLWVFPEGREGSPFGVLDLKPGAAQIARVSKRAVVLPVGLRYVFGATEFPDLWISFGHPLAAQRDILEGVQGQRRGIERELARIDAGLESRVDVVPLGFTCVLSKRSSLFGDLATKLLVRMLGG